MVPTGIPVLSLPFKTKAWCIRAPSSKLVGKDGAAFKIGKIYHEYFTCDISGCMDSPVETNLALIDSHIYRVPTKLRTNGCLLSGTLMLRQLEFTPIVNGDL